MIIIKILCDLSICVNVPKIFTVFLFYFEVTLKRIYHGVAEKLKRLSKSLEVSIGDLKHDKNMLSWYFFHRCNIEYMNLCGVLDVL